ncbi:MAG: MFS transporter [Nitrospina sp.]|nr:MAG: MFS transporter [Nitrospina sp.]
MNESHDNLKLSENSTRTFHLDLLRGMFRGVLTSGTQTFGLFIAIRYFNANDICKSLIGAAPFIGMLLSLLLVYYASRTQWKNSTWGGLSAAVCGVFLLTAAFTTSLWSYTVAVVLGFAFLTALLPFLTAIYHDNYPANRRGAFYSRAVIVTVVVSACSGFLGSSWLDQDLRNYQWILIFLGLAGLGKAYAIYLMPSQKMEDSDYAHPLGNFRLIFEDRSFGYILLTWFIMGFANLWVLPLRVDYLTSSVYGIEGSALFVATIITIIPDSMRALSLPFLAKLFDEINFIVLRMFLNVTFAVGIGLFFLTREPWVIALGSALIGIAFGGGTIAWNLWVTKYAPPGKVAAYMSVHVGLTGIRGTLGPMVGFWAVSHIGPTNIGLVSFAMMILATVMLVPEIKHGKGRNTSGSTH